MKKNDALHRIMENLKNGKRYGKQVDYVRYPYFSTVLSIHESNYNSKNYIFWCHYGSSANKVTLKDLDWIIRVMFNMTPEQFEAEYEMQ